jgi:hypothetical protein
MPMEVPDEVAETRRFLGAFSMNNDNTPSQVADLYLTRPAHKPEPLGPKGAVLSTAMLHARLDSIRAMCVAGAPLYPIVAELRYVADELDRIDKLTKPGAS